MLLKLTFNGIRGRMVFLKIRAIEIISSNKLYEPIIGVDDANEKKEEVIILGKFVYRNRPTSGLKATIL